MNTEKQLFKYSKPIIREFQYPEDGQAGDLPIVWDAYKKGSFDDLREDLTMGEFIEVTEAFKNNTQEAWMVEEIVNGGIIPVAVIFCTSDGWKIEPHAVFFDNVTPKMILRCYVAFLKKAKYRKNIGACVVKCPKKFTNLANRIEKLSGKKLLEYVGKIWGGLPDDNEYIYSVRCSRRH